jgi:hypothetical protein
MISVPVRVNRAIIASGAIAATGLTLLFAAPDALAAASAHGKPSTSAGSKPAASSHGKHSTAADPKPTKSAQGKAGGTGNGDNGDVKIHRSTTAVTDQRNQPHVCTFYLDAFNFDSGQSVSWQIKSWPPTGNRSVVKSGALVLGGDGDGHTGDMSLQNGHYKLFWNFTGENGFAKQKVFWVSCPGTAPSPGPSHKPKGKKTPVPAAPAAKPVTGTLPVTG